MAYARAEADLRAVLPLSPSRRSCRTAMPTSVRPDRALHVAIPDSTLTVLPGLGHECFLESAAAFEDAVRVFLRYVGEFDARPR